MFASFHELKIFDTVIRTVEINMMYYFILQQPPPDGLLHYDHMLTPSFICATCDLYITARLLR